MSLYQKGHKGLKRIVAFFSAEAPPPSSNGAAASAVGQMAGMGVGGGHMQVIANAGLASAAEKVSPLAELDSQKRINPD